jgi:predicted AlkP superfamily phosphohydrolase/phosphomutase
MASDTPRGIDRVQAVTTLAQRWLAIVGLSLLAGCGDTESTQPGPVVLLGVDGGSWNAIRDLWDRDQLPHLKALAERGVSAQLQPVANASPVIWTSIATGVRPSRHGIQGFTVRTDSGEVPVSSADRRVPALWNMATSEGLRVALLGWWASWPAEAVNGVVLSDRIFREEEGRFHPPDFDPGLDKYAAREGEDPSALGGVVGRQDAVMASVGLELAKQEFDLILLYLRNVDAQSHHYWKYFRPQGFEDEVDAASLELLGSRVPDAYDSVDQTLGELVARAPTSTNFFVLSDHGFQAAKGERYRIQLHLDRILEHLGFLVRDGEKIDPDQSVARTWSSPPFTRTKLIRFQPFDRQGSEEGPGDPDSTRRQLEADLEKITYQDGSPVFRFRDLEAKERSRGGDMVVIVRYQGVSSEVLFDGQPIPGAIGQIEEISGTHSKSTEGIFIAAGPDIDSSAELVEIHSLDITPTLLFALGLPVAEDFDGRARTEIFQPRFREQHPLRAIPTWGVLEARDSPDSQSDEELLEELRALGYLN